MSCLTLSTVSAASTESNAALALKPKVLRQMMQATPTPKPAASTRTAQPGGEGAIPFPATITFDATGCFAGYFSYERMAELRFECIKGAKALDLRTISSITFEEAKGKLVVLELVPSFAGDLCKACATVSAELREQLKSRSFDAKIFRTDIAH